MNGNARFTEFAAPDGQAGFYRASLLNCSPQSSRGYKGGSRRSFAGEAQSAGKNNMPEAVASLPARQDLLEISEFGQLHGTRDIAALLQESS